MKVNAGANVTLNAGTYYFDGGDLTVNGGATMTGSDVTLVFTSQNRNGFGTVQINGNATISLTAPKTERQPGSSCLVTVACPQARISSSMAGNSIFWRRHLCSLGRREFRRGASTSTNCTQLIASTVTFTGNSGFALNCNNYGTKPFSPQVVKLTS